MTLHGDHDADMAPNWQIDDDIAEAIVRDEVTGAPFASLTLFARSVRAAGEQPPPPASGELAELLAGGHGHQTQPHHASAARRSTSVGRHRRSKRRYRVPVGIAALGGKVASLGLAGKAAAASGAVALGTLTAGASGVAPAPVNDVVQGAISNVTPFDLGGSDDVDAGVDVGNTGSVGAEADPDSGAGAGVGATADDATGAGTGAVDGVTGTATGAVDNATGTAEGLVDGALDQADDVPVVGEVVPGELPPPPSVPGVPGLPGVPGVPAAPGAPPVEAGVGAQASR